MIIPHFTQTHHIYKNNSIISQLITKPYILLIIINISFFLLFYYQNIGTSNFNIGNRNLQLDSDKEKTNDKDVYLKTNFTTRQEEILSLIYETYNGTWSSNSSLYHFTTKNGTVQFVFKIFRRFKGLKGLYFNYEFYLFENQYNTHTHFISNTNPFSLDNGLPDIFIAKSNKTILMNNTQYCFINEMNYLTSIGKQSAQVTINLKYSNENFAEKAMKGLIEFDNISIDLDMTKNNTEFYTDLFSLFALLFIVSIFQISINHSLLRNLRLQESEALKYSSHNVLINCTYNGAIWFECFLASMHDEKLGKFFAFPVFGYMLNFFFIEPKLYFHISKVQIEMKYTDNIIRMTAMKRQAIKFYVYYILLLSMLFYSYDLFFWRTFNYFFVGMTFICQIGYNFKSMNKQMMNYDYIAIVSLNRVLFPLFFRAKPNFLYFEIDYLFSLIIILVIMIQIGVLVLQKYYRNDYLHKLIFHSNEYNYFKSLKDIIKMQKDILPTYCSICYKGFIRDKNGNNTTVVITQPNALIEINNNITVKDELNLDSTTFDKDKDKDKDQDKDKDKDKNIINNKKNKNEEKDKIELSTENNNKKVKKKRRKTCSCFKKDNFNLNEIVMITPCNHVYHIDCLQDWMKIKPNCPVCRADLPKVV